MRLKIMWYNIKRGFHSREKDNSSIFEPKRMNAAKKLISEFNPDILFLGEADFNPDCERLGYKGKIIDYKEIFEFPFVFYSAVTDRKGEAILSKIKFEAKSKSLELISNIRSIWNIDGKKITMNVIHPHPKIPEIDKAKKIKEILKNIPKNYVILGDFNALSPEDSYSVEELAEGFKSARGEGAKENAIDALQCLMIKEVLNKGLVDTYRAKNKERGDTIPTKGFSQFKNNFGDMRLDYIFCSKEFRIIESGIIKNKLTDMASDHYPIYAVLELK